MNLDTIKGNKLPHKYPLGLEGMQRKYHDRYIIDIDYDGAPCAPLGVLLRKYRGIYLILDDVLANEHIFKKVYQELLDILKWGFTYDEIRKLPMHFKIHEDDDVVHVMELNKFLSNMILWWSWMIADKVDQMTEDDIMIFCEEKSMNDTRAFIDDHIVPLFGDNNKGRNAVVAEISFHMSSITRAFGMIIGLGISVYNIIQSEKQNPEIHEIMYGHIPTTLTPHEMEHELSHRTARLIKAFCETDSDLRPLLLAGKNINHGQLRETFIKIAYKADTNGNTIPYVVDANLMINGICKPAYYYILAISGRKSLVLTKVSMSDPGTFSKRVINNTTSAAYLDVVDEDYSCDTCVHVTYEIRNKTWLKCLNGRFYLDEETGEYKQVNYKTDEHLIGTKQKFRSPVTCTDPDGVCHTCYGALYDINKDLNSAGAFAATKAGEPMGQIILSSKHHQSTDSVPIAFSDRFGEVFELASAEITLREDNNDDEEATNEWSLIFDEVYIEESEDVDVYYVKKFQVLNETTGELITIEEENGSSMYMTDELIKIYKGLRTKTKPIPVADLEDSVSVLFNVEVKNSELSEPLKVINTILNTSGHGGAKTIDEICQLVGDFYLDTVHIEYDLVHFEMIVRGLIRKESNIMEFPDFGPDGDHNDYQILSINASLFNNPSPTTSMLYGYLRKQFKGAAFWKKTSPGHTDPMFVSRLYDIMPDEDRVNV